MEDSSLYKLYVDFIFGERKLKEMIDEMTKLFVSH